LSRTGTWSDGDKKGHCETSPGWEKRYGCQSRKKHWATRREWSTSLGRFPQSAVLRLNSDDDCSTQTARKLGSTLLACAAMPRRGILWCCKKDVLRPYRHASSGKKDWQDVLRSFECTWTKSTVRLPLGSSTSRCSAHVCQVISPSRRGPRAPRIGCIGYLAPISPLSPIR
jgi:hypothetical protein